MVSSMILVIDEQVVILRAKQVRVVSVTLIVTTFARWKDNLKKKSLRMVAQCTFVSFSEPTNVFVSCFRLAESRLKVMFTRFHLFEVISYSTKTQMIWDSTTNRT